MPELPEITVIAKQMHKELEGKTIEDVEIKQPKNLNVPVSKFVKAIKGKTVEDVSSHGKWLFMKLNQARYLLINLGMGAELIYFKPEQKLPDQYQFKLVFADKTGFTAHFWWFGYIHLASETDMRSHKMTASLGKSPMDKAFTLDYFKKVLGNRKTNVKSFLLDQKNVAGIGNVYIQDLLFKAKLHPNRKILTLTETEKKKLYSAIRDVLNRSIRLDGLAYEKDFYGRKGRFTGAKFLVGYKTGKPCPTCGTIIEKIRTGSTASYICPKCQQLS